MNMISFITWIGVIVSAGNAPVAVQSNETYGDARVIEVSRIDESCVLYCDIKDFPPIIGRNMPVKINGLRTSASIVENQKIRTFLNVLLKAKTNSSKIIQLKNIQRGEKFCFLADIEIDGKDICDLLVENGLAHRIITVSGAETQRQTSSQLTRSQASRTSVQRSPKNTYVASKTSKIFHRIDCSHAKRISPERAVYFSSRQEAAKTGREPCKVCKP